MLGKPYDRVGAALVEQFVAELMLLGVACLLSDATEKEPDPRHQVALLAGEEQMVVVLAAMLLEVGREVEQRLWQCLAQYEHERDHQSADAAVAVEERMDDLELVVSDGELDQEREFGLVEEAFEVGERVVHLVGRRRDEDGVVERAAAEPDRAPP